MACRDVSKAEKAADEIREEVEIEAPHEKVGKLIIKKLDLSSLESIRSFVDDLNNDSENQINILINNAGVMSPTHQMTKDGFELVFGTNHLGHFYLTCLLLPKILASAPARIVNVSSIAYGSGQIHWDDLNLEKSYGTWTSYAQSKLANVLFARELASRLKGTRVTVYALKPGVIATDINRFLDDYFLGFIRVIWRYVCPLVRKSSLEGATTSLYCALDTSLAEESGLYYSDCARKEVEPHARSDEDAKRLWEESLKLVGLEDFHVENNTICGLRTIQEGRS